MQFQSRSRYLAINGLLAIGLALVSPSAKAEVGVTDKEIVVGMTGNLVGPTASYGFGSKEGIEAVFKRVNSAGGVNGRMLRLIFKEDEFKPDLALANAKVLIEKEKVFLLLGGNGSPAAGALLPYVAKSGVPQLFRISGVENLRQPNAAHNYNLRTGYAEEAETLIGYVVKKKGMSDIGILFQDDAFGKGNRNAVAKALMDNGQKLKLEQTYQLNDENFAKQIDAFLKSDVKAIFLASSYKASIAFIKQTRAKGFKGVFLGNSLMTATFVIEQAGQDAENTYLTDILPLPTNTEFALVRQFQTDMKSAGFTTLDGPHLEGYLSGEVFVWAVKTLGKNVTRTGIEKAIENIKGVDFGGVKLTWNPLRRQLIDSAYPLSISEGKISQVQIK